MTSRAPLNVLENLDELVYAERCSDFIKSEGVKEGEEICIKHGAPRPLAQLDLEDGRELWFRFRVDKIAFECR